MDVGINRLIEEVARMNEKRAREEDRVAKMEMKKANEKILERRRERLMRRLRRAKTKKKWKSQDSESFTSSEDETWEEEVKRSGRKRLKAIRESITLTEIEAEDAKIEEASKTEEADDHNMFPRPRGRLIRYLRPLRSRESFTWTLTEELMNLDHLLDSYKLDLYVIRLLSKGCGVLRI